MLYIVHRETIIELNNKKEIDMSTSAFVIALVAIIGGIAYSAYEQYVKLQLKNQNSATDSDTQDVINELKQRIEVLEKIITDEKYTLKNEINKLSKVS